MNFNRHSYLEGQHAFLSASRYHWINYDEEKLTAVYTKFLATKKGTELHELASQCIRLGVKLPKADKTLNLYVNDAIGFRMTAEQPLYFSANCFGTADAICFRGTTLRIHDLKTGQMPTSFKQLEVYSALFCLEYLMDPMQIEIELRIYQNDQVHIHIPSPQAISDITHKIVEFDKVINKIKQEV